MLLIITSLTLLLLVGLVVMCFKAFMPLKQLLYSMQDIVNEANGELEKLRQDIDEIKPESK